MSGGKGMSRLKLAGAALVMAGLVAGCTEYLDRRESVVMWAGDAQRANLITHAVHPLPRHAFERRLRMDGQRMQAAHERYRAGAVIPPDTNRGTGTIGTRALGGS